MSKEIIRKAMKTRTLINIVGYGEDITRLVAPFTVGTSSKGEEVLRAYEQGKGWRLFKLDRMLATPTNEGYDELNPKYSDYNPYDKDMTMIELMLSNIVKSDGDNDNPFKSKFTKGTKKATSKAFKPNKLINYIDDIIKVAKYL